MNGDRAEEWIPLAEALAFVDLFEKERRTILGIDLARITPDGKVLLPAFADFSGATAEESWADARRLLADELPEDATHATFTG